MKYKKNEENIFIYNSREETIENKAIFSSHINWSRQSKHMGCNNPKIKWEFKLDDNVHESSPVIGSDGTIYIGGDRGYLYAIQEDGRLKWQKKLDNNLIMPVIVNNKIYISTTGAVGTKAHKVYSLNIDGTIDWVCEIGEPTKYSPVVTDGGEVYVVSHGSKLTKLNKYGSVDWEFHKQFGCTFMPCIGNNGTIYIGGGRSVTAVNTDGTEQWSIPLNNLQSPSPIIDNSGIIYVDLYEDNQAKMFAINPDGTIKWKYSHEKDIWTSPALSNNGILYVGATYLKLLAINVDGTLKWETRVEGFLTSPPLIGIDGTIYATTSMQITNAKHISRLFAFNEDGELKWVIKVNGSTNWPALGKNSTFYLALHDSTQKEIGRLCAIGD